MPEPTSAAAAGAAVFVAAPTVAALTVFGVNTGLHAEQLLAGFLGALAAIALLDSVPSTGDTWRELIRTSSRRIGVAVGSAVTAGYVAPLVGLINGIPPALLLGVTFVVGAGAQRILRGLIENASKGKGVAGVAGDKQEPAQ